MKNPLEKLPSDKPLKIKSKEEEEYEKIKNASEHEAFVEESNSEKNAELLARIAEGDVYAVRKAAKRQLEKK